MNSINRASPCWAQTLSNPGRWTSPPCVSVLMVFAFSLGLTSCCVPRAGHKAKQMCQLIEVQYVANGTWSTTQQIVVNDDRSYLCGNFGARPDRPPLTKGTLPEAIFVALRSAIGTGVGWRRIGSSPLMAYVYGINDTKTVKPAGVSQALLFVEGPSDKETQKLDPTTGLFVP